MASKARGAGKDKPGIRRGLLGVVWLCGFWAGLAVGVVLGLAVCCQPQRDETTGILTVQYNGAPYELVRLLGDLEVVKND